MKAPQHTPGPWAAEAAMSMDTPHIRYITADTRIIASVRHRAEHTQDMALANARLIAAAPELLEALRRMLPELRGLAFVSDTASEMLRIAEAAIAKATGETP